MRQVFLDTFDLAGQLVERALVGLVRNQRLALRNSLPNGLRLGIGDGFLSCRSRFGGLIGGSNLSTAILAAAVLALVIWYVMQKTSRGYEMKLTGQNERFARFIGIRTSRLVLVCMLLSGALCGLVGMFRVYGAEHLFRDSISRDYYFEGLMVAMIARYQPLAVVFLSLFFAALKIGAQGMELAAGVPNQIYLIIQTVVIFLMAAESGLFGALQNRVRKGKEAEKHA